MSVVHTPRQRICEPNHRPAGRSAELRFGL